MIKKARKLFSIVKEMNLVLLRALRLGVAAAIEHKQILKKQKYKTIVDIGANRGQFALVARNILPDAKIVSFEPLANPASKYSRVFEGDSKVKLYQAAIAQNEGVAVIHISNRDDSSSLLPITSTQSNLFPGTEESGITKIKTAPLIKYLHRDDIVAPALLKLDVQGYELEALRGSEELLDKFDNVYVECSFIELYQGQAMASEVIDYLYKKEYVLDGVYNIYYDQNGIAIQADFLFGRRNYKE